MCRVIPNLVEPRGINKGTGEKYPLPIVAEYAVDAAERAQVILTTHSPQFLDAFEDTKPAATVAKWVNGQTILKTLKGEKLERWLKEYSLGSLYRSGELEDMAEDGE